jgi:hypothetical protein
VGGIPLRGELNFTLEIAMKVNLGFGGMCLFLPELDGAANLHTMHVVMPSGFGHKTFLVYDEKALNGDPTTGNPLSDSLEHWALDLRHLGTTPALTPPPAGVADLESCPGFPSSRLSDFSPTWINARVTFSAGTSSIPLCAHGSHWKFGPGAAKPLAIRVVWSIIVPDGTVAVEVPDATQPGGKRPVTLFPDRRTNVLDLWVFHTPRLPRLLPPRTSLRTHPSNTPAAHFHFPHLLGCPAMAPPHYDRLVIAANELLCFVLEDDPLLGDRLIDGLDVMCIAAKATLVP